MENHRDPSRNPLFQVLFSLNQRFQASNDTKAESDLRLRSIPEGDTKTSPFDLQLIVNDFGGSNGMLAALQYSTALFLPDTIARASGHLLTLWASIVSDNGPTMPLGSLEMLPMSELSTVLAKFNKVPSDAFSMLRKPDALPFAGFDSR